MAISNGQNETISASGGLGLLHKHILVFDPILKSFLTNSLFLSEYGYMMKITEKSDVYSFGVVVLEVLTGKQPIDPTIPEGQHVVDWVRHNKGVGVLDAALLSRSESEIEEMVQVLGIALLCVNFAPDERPNMKDVAAMLKEIKQETDSKIDLLVEGGSTDGQENKRPKGVLALTSSSKLGIESVRATSDGFSLSSSSLIYPSSSIPKM